MSVKCGRPATPAAMGMAAHSHRGFKALLGSIGVVYGDIGQPTHALREAVVAASGVRRGQPQAVPACLADPGR